MKLRALLVFGLLGSVSASFASFEMMLVAGDEGIHRYDPQNNVVLGKFAQLDGAHLDVSLDPTRPGEVVSINSFGTINRYDYNTGEYRGGFSIGNIFVNEIPRVSVMASGNILVSAFLQSAGAPVTRMYSPTGALITSLDSFGPSYQTLDSIQAPGGSLHTLVRLSGFDGIDYFLGNFTETGSFTGLTQIVNDPVNGTRFGTLGIVNNKVVAASGYYSTTADQLYSFNSGFFDAPTAISVNVSVGSIGASNYVGGHNGYGYMIHSYSTSGTQRNRLYRYNPGSNFASLTSVNPALNDQIYGSAIVLAPEPGTMIALGLGLAAVVRRRKNSA
jgi:hypothetical protein